MPNPLSDVGSRRGSIQTAQTIAPTSPGMTSGTLGEKRGNLFKSLAEFFAPDDFLQQHRHVQVLADLLEDFILRKGHTFDGLVSEFTVFFHSRREEYEEQQCRTFLQAMVLVFVNNVSAWTKPVSCVSSFEGLLRMLWQLTQSFQDLFGGLCRCDPRSQQLNSGSKLRDKSLRRHIQTLLNYGANVDVTFRDRSLRLINAPMMYGETVIILAARNRHPDVILLLLRHGADVTTSWLCYESALEVLLFAPAKQHVSDQEKRKIEQGVEYFSRAMTCINFKRLVKLRDEGYAQLHEKWTQLLPVDRHKNPSTLRHLAKCAVRETLNRNRNLPSAVSQLPVPEMIKNYVDLKILI